MSLWDWAVKVYARPGVAETCLELQDRHGQCVPYLLWAAWAAAEGRAPAPQALADAAAMSAAWASQAMAPLRAARRAMKAEAPGIDPAAREALRGELKTLELKAEHLLMETLEQAPLLGEPESLDLALAAAAEAHGGAPGPLLRRLALALA